MIDTSTIGLAAAIITILGAIYAMLRWGNSGIQWAWRRVSRYRPTVPRETVRIIPQTRGHWWHLGSIGSHPAMQVVSEWHVTNITDRSVYLLRAYLIRPHTEGMVIVRRHGARIFGDYPIPPGATTEVHASFWIQPPIRRVGEDLNATVVFVDQYGNEHRKKNVIFRGPRPQEPKRVDPPKEAIHAITDPIEKEIVAVLKDEVHRYDQCGRRVGGLGSVLTTYQGRIMNGVGTDWRMADSPRRQSIVPNPDAATIESDNATALTNLYGRLGDDEKKSDSSLPC